VDSSPVGTEHPDSRMVAAYLDGALTPEARAQFEAHAVDCVACRQELIEVARVLRPRRRRVIRYTYVGACAAAAAAVVVFVWPKSRSEAVRSSDYREPVVSTTLAPVPVSPRGASAAPSHLVWTAVAGVRLYELTLYDERGQVLWETESSDTVASLPDSIRLKPGASYFWRVEARTAWRRQAASDLTEFSVGRPQ
jgi:hypothetical protein